MEFWVIIGHFLNLNLHKRKIMRTTRLNVMYALI